MDDEEYPRKIINIRLQAEINIFYQRCVNHDRLQNARQKPTEDIEQGSDQQKLDSGLPDAVRRRFASPYPEAHADHEYRRSEGAEPDHCVPDGLKGGRGKSGFQNLLHHMDRGQADDRGSFQQFKFSKTGEWFFRFQGWPFHLFPLRNKTR